MNLHQDKDAFEELITAKYYRKNKVLLGVFLHTALLFHTL